MENINQTPFIGSLWETLVFSELRKKIKNSLPQANLWFYRDSRQREIDFILENDSKLNLIEVKWTEKPDQKDSSTLKIIYQEMLENSQKLIYQMGDKIILSRTGHQFQNEAGIQINNLNYIFDLGQKKA